MKIMISLVFMTLLAAPVGAKPLVISTAAVTAVQPQAKKIMKRKAAPARLQTGKNESAGIDNLEEENDVMVDAKSDDNDPDRFSDSDSPSFNESVAASETEEPAVPGGIPASYGQLKGTLNDGGRSLLVFENEDGVISLVQIFAKNNAAGWHLVSRVYRSAD
jgi:hypothetical protein